MKISVILPAAGLGTRMGRAAPEKGGISRKQFMLLDGSPILLHTIRKFASFPPVTEIVVALRQEDIEWVRDLLAQERFDKPVRLVEGGDSRQNSVENAVSSIPPDTDLVAVHDAVRPFIDHHALEQVFAEAAENGAAIVGIVPVDTIKQVHRNKIRATLPRDRLIMAQTPQVFRFDLLKKAFERAREDGFIGTDESSLVERLEQVEVSVVPGSDRNIKITKPSDMDLARLFLAEELIEFRMGQGWDVHRIVPGRLLILGGVVVPCEFGLEGHSDADVLSHAITDAILGAAALGDIGMHFPDTDPRWKGAGSLQFLSHAYELAREQGFRLLHVDSTVILERPKLKDYRLPIRRSIADTLRLDLGRVSVKFKTAEGVGAVGEGRSAEAQAVVTLCAEADG
jgi:2-C-methyl-D-erythritol 4-phosphate cytidylyltransferase/2-C-methyl-D-erythritol 2,4-cyclodiphosphate synthase